MFSNGIVIRPLNLVYFYIPKVACSSLKRLFANFLGLSIPDNGYHVHAVDFEMVSPDQMVVMEDFQAFAVVRNPYARLWSLYCNKIHDDCRNTEYCKNGVEQAAFSPFEGRFWGDMSFEEFIDVVTNIPAEEANPHFRPQSLMVPAQAQIFYMEAIAALQIWLNAKGVRRAVPHLNKSSQGRWQEHYSERTAAKVRGYYIKDFERFKYGYANIGL